MLARHLSAISAVVSAC